MVRGNSFDCRRHDCTRKPGKDCPHCGMPDVRKDVSFILDLYARCRSNNALPYAGGILNQPAWIMDLFEVIDNVKASYRKEKGEAERVQAELEAKSNGRS